MAERRMFAKSIIDSDYFLEMPLSAQALYFHLSMRADDDGFIGNCKRIKALIGASDDDLKLLITKSFILTFENGVIVIKHWKIHNYIRSDRYKETIYSDEKNALSVDKSGSYSCENTLGIPNVYQMSTNRLTSGTHRLGKVSIGKVNIDGGNYNILDKDIESEKKALQCNENVTQDNRYKRIDNRDKILDNRDIDGGKTPQQETTKPQKYFGTYGNIKVSDEFYEKFTEKYRFYKNIINSLSEYKHKNNIMSSVNDEYFLELRAEEDEQKYENSSKNDFCSFDTNDFFEMAIKHSYTKG